MVDRIAPITGPTGYDYGRTPGLFDIAGLLDAFTPTRREIVSPSQTRFEEMDGLMYPVTTPAVYGEPETGIEYMPAYRAASSVADYLGGLMTGGEEEREMLVEGAKAVPGALAGQIDDYYTAMTQTPQGAAGLVTPEGEVVEANPLLPMEYLLGGSIGAMRAGDNVLGAAGGRLTKAEKDPMEYSKTEMPYRIEDTPMVIDDTSGLLMPERKLDIEGLQGKVLMPFFTDRSAIGGDVRSVDGVELTSPVTLEGGAGFMRGPAAQGDDALWASLQGVVTKMANKAQKASDEAGGADVVGVNAVMGIDAIDHSTMPTKIVSRMLPNMKIDAKAKKSFDEAMQKVDEDFPGVDADNLEDYLDSATGEVRKQFIRLMDMKDAKKAGFPNIGAVRRAVTEPKLYDTPTFSEGVSFGLLDVNNPVIDSPQFPHTTYSGQLRAGNVPNQSGGYLGGLLDALAPQGTFFPSSFGPLSTQLNKRGELLTPQNIKYAQDRQLPTQFVDQQMIDNLMQNSLLGR